MCYSCSMNIKTCTKCGIEKEIAEFSKDKLGKNGLHWVCKTCVQIYVKSYQQRNKEKINKWHRNYRKENKKKILIRERSYYKKNKDRFLNKRLKYHFGITLEQFNLLLKNQNGVCAICGNKETAINGATKKVRLLNVDHDHQTGKVRGLLCSKCNHMIGLGNDDTNIFKSAINYLKKDK
jgi:hypothetical protein